MVLGRDNHQISADFPGVAARCIEAATGGRALFVNGACGDVNPRIANGSFADVDRLGEELGRAVLEGRAEATPVDASALRWAHERLDLPLRPLPPRWRAEAEKLKWHPAGAFGAGRRGAHSAAQMGCGYGQMGEGWRGARAGAAL